MGWSLGYDENWKRDIGYGVPAHCDHPKCRRVIDRGLAYVCGGEPYGGDEGCGLFFCGKHLYCGNKAFVCDRCFDRLEPYEPKPDHPKWIQQKARMTRVYDSNKTPAGCPSCGLTWSTHCPDRFHRHADSAPDVPFKAD